MLIVNDVDRWCLKFEPERKDQSVTDSEVLKASIPFFIFFVKLLSSLEQSRRGLLSI